MINKNILQLNDSSKPNEVVEYIGECIAKYPNELSSAQVAYYIIDLGRYEWEHELSLNSDSFCEIMDIVNDMEQ